MVELGLIFEFEFLESFLFLVPKILNLERMVDLDAFCLIFFLFFPSKVLISR